MKIKFGPAGIGQIREVEETFKKYSELGLKACEIPLTYGVYIKKDIHNAEIKEIRDSAKKFGIELSIHAPYWVNLNSKEKEKVEASKKRILDSCEVGDLLGVKRVVFHAGFYGKMEKEEAFENIKKGILEMMEIIKKNKWDVELCPEVMGKKNVFGSISEIARLVDETGCGFCIDFAHILARYGKHEFDLVKKIFKQKHWHCHFSGIVYGEKGEKKHKATEIEDWEGLLKELKGFDKEIVIINEGLDTVGDSVVGLKIFKEME